MRSLLVNIHHHHENASSILYPPPGLIEHRSTARFRLCCLDACPRGVLCAGMFAHGDRALACKSESKRLRSLKNVVHYKMQFSKIGSRGRSINGLKNDDLRCPYFKTPPYGWMMVSISKMTTHDNDTTWSRTTSSKALCWTLIGADLKERIILPVRHPALHQPSWF